MSAQVTGQSIIANILQAFFTGVQLGKSMIPDIMMSSFLYSAPEEQGVKVKQEANKEHIEIDVDKMDIGKFYMVKYHDEAFIVRKIGNEQIAFYDVIE